MYVSALALIFQMETGFRRRFFVINYTQRNDHHPSLLYANVYQVTWKVQEQATERREGRYENDRVSNSLIARLSPPKMHFGRRVLVDD